MPNMRTGGSSCQKGSVHKSRSLSQVQTLVGEPRNTRKWPPRWRPSTCMPIGAAELARTPSEGASTALLEIADYANHLVLLHTDNGLVQLWTPAYSKQHQLHRCICIQWVFRDARTISLIGRERFSCPAFLD